MNFVKPMQHQKEAVLRIEQCHGRTLLADDMGLGKTITILGTLKRNPDWLPAVVVCPTNVKYNWEREAKAFFGMQSSICEGEKPPDENSNRGIHYDTPLIIINYEILQYWMDYLIGQGFSTIIFDECQYLCERTSIRTRRSKEMASQAKQVIGMSGTPMMQRPSELYPILNMIWPDEFFSFWDFAQKYCAPKFVNGKWDFTGASNLTELNERLTDLGMIRRTEEILHLPEKTVKIVPVELSDPEEYRFASSDFMGWMKQNHSHKARRAKKAEKMVRVGYLLRLAAKLKLKAVVQRANWHLESDPERKIVLMAVHQKAIQVLQKRINTESIIIDGNVNGRARQAAIDQFQNNKEIRACIGQIKAAGVGITLTKADLLMFVEFWWNPPTHNQALKRIHRIGQTRPVTVEYTVAKGTLEEHLCRLLQERQKNITAAIDGGEVPDESFNLYEELLKVLEREI